jgi:hypothetical protein
MLNLKVKSKLVYTQLLIFGYLLTIGAWTAGTFVKLALAERMASDLYPWAVGYFSAHMCKLFNYCFTAAAFAVFYFIFLSSPFIDLLKSKMQIYRPGFNIFFIVLMIVALAATQPIDIGPRIILFLAVGGCSVFYLCFPELFLKRGTRRG